MRGSASLLRTGIVMGAVLVLVAIVGPSLAPFDPAEPVAPQLAEPMPPGHALLCICKFVRRIRHSRDQGAMRAAPIVMSDPLLQD